MYAVGIVGATPAYFKSTTCATEAEAIEWAKRLALSEGKDVGVYKLVQTHHYKATVQEVAVESYPVISEAP